MALKRKNIVLLAFVTFASMFCLSSCKQDKSKSLIGKWQHIYIVRLTAEGNDTTDMQGANTFNSFHEDGTLYITNGEKDVNVQYLVKDNALKTFQLNKPDTISMNIKQLDKTFLILQVHWKDSQRPDELLIYKKAQ